MPENSKEQLKECGELWNEYEPFLRKYCVHRLSSCPQEIDDVISETYLALCSAINENTEIESPKAWLYVTINDIIKNKYSEIEEIRKTEINIDKYGLIYEIDYVDKLIDKKDIGLILDEILNLLSDDERRLLSLFYEKGLSYKEISEILGSNEFAVKQRSYRLKKKIKKMINSKLENFC